MFFYNTMTKQKEKFMPLNDKEIKIYSCGPTVYNFIHIGNSRPLCIFDVLRNFLKYIGYNVKFVQNFTDIDDKIINRANEENTDFMTISKKYIKEFKIDSDGLNIKEADVHPLATETISEMIEIIKILINKNHAYKLENGDVYFRAKSFKDYGKLSHQSIDDLESGARIEVNESKENPLDFALWKSSKHGEPFWASPWGNGRPGWHIECTAMVFKFLGESIDIHCGGQDLIFPHHENEIAQSECASGKSFCKYWLHNGYINIDDKKMSKSLNNFLTVREISQKYGYEPIRYLMISSHYRSPINYSDEIINHCIHALERLSKFKQNLIFCISSRTSLNAKEIKLDYKNYKSNFLLAMEDDLNTSKALSVIFDMVKDTNIILSNHEDLFLKSDLENILNLFNEFAEVLGILYENKNLNNIDSKINDLLKKRQEARDNKDFKLADNIRDELKNLGITIEDTPQGQKIV